MVCIIINYGIYHFINLFAPFGTLYTLDYYSAEVCSVRKREHDRKDRNIVDRNSEKVQICSMHFTL